MFPQHSFIVSPVSTRAISSTLINIELAHILDECKQEFVFVLSAPGKLHVTLVLVCPAMSVDETLMQILGFPLLSTLVLVSQKCNRCCMETSWNLDIYECPTSVTFNTDDVNTRTTSKQSHQVLGL